jgi:hypothetical protein
MAVKLQSGMSFAEFADDLKTAVREQKSVTFTVIEDGVTKKMIVTPDGGVPISTEPPPLWVLDASDSAIFDRLVAAAKEGTQAELRCSVTPAKAPTTAWLVKVELTGG